MTKLNRINQKGDVRRKQIKETGLVMPYYRWFDVIDVTAWDKLF